MSAQKERAPQWFNGLPLATQVARARNAASQLIVEGIDTYTRHGEDLPQRVLDIVKRPEVDRFYESLSDANRVECDDALHAARALGIAIGLMLRPSALTGGEQ